jgi:dipeptidyl aminopeptidase/acylaminoacyl peptidase
MKLNFILLIDIDVMLIVPEDFDQNSTRKYPLILHVYGGPGSDGGSVTQNYIYNQFSAFMASNRSVIYALIDARGSPNHGIKFMYDIYRKFGSVEVEDTITVARYDSFIYDF